MELNSTNEIQLNTPEKEAFAAEVEQAKISLAKADRTPKRGRGRPSKKEKAVQIAEQKAENAAVVAQVLPPEALGPILDMPFDIAAMQTGFSGFKLDETEKKAILPSFHAVVQAYAPQIKSEDMAIISFSAAILGVSLTKYMAYMAHLKAMEQKTNEVAA